MILIDLSQILFASASMSMKNGKADINIVRHMTLNSLKNIEKNILMNTENWLYVVMVNTLGEERFFHNTKQ